MPDANEAPQADASLLIALSAGAAAGGLGAVATVHLWIGRVGETAAGIALVLAVVAATAALRRLWRRNARHGHPASTEANAAEDAEDLVPTLDAATLEALERLGGPRFVTDVADQFSAEANQLMLKIAASIGERDEEAFRSHTHALRSSAANVGALRLYRLCLAWRDLDARALAQGGAERLAELRREFESARRALARRLAQQRDDWSPRQVTPLAKAG